MKSNPLFNKVEGKSLEEKLKKIHSKGNKKRVKGTKMDQTEKIPFKDFKRLDIRIGTITTAEKIPKAKNLLKLQVDLGDEIGIRQLVAGLASFRTPEKLVNQRVTVIVNLEPVKIRGVLSNGMLLAAVEGEELGLLIPDIQVSNGTKVS